MFLRARTFFASILAVALVACGSSTADPQDACTAPASPAAFELGTGETCFARVTAMQTLPAMHGPQGGWHLWTAFGCANCGPQAIVQYGVRDPMTKDWLSGAAQQAVVDLSSSAWPQSAGLTSFLPGNEYFEPDAQLPKGSHVLLSLSVLDVKQAVLHEAEVEVVLGDIQSWNPCDDSPECDPNGEVLGQTPCCGR
ncbi:MAG: hypothetical protein QM820_58955 [Minicystis sp.]